MKALFAPKLSLFYVFSRLWTQQVCEVSNRATGTLVLVGWLNYIYLEAEVYQQQAGYLHVYDVNKRTRENASVSKAIPKGGVEALVVIYYGSGRNQKGELCYLSSLYCKK